MDPARYPQSASLSRRIALLAWGLGLAPLGGCAARTDDGATSNCQPAGTALDAGDDAGAAGAGDAGAAPKKPPCPPPNTSGDDQHGW